jgi:hypothetical protein
LIANGDEPMSHNRLSDRINDTLGLLNGHNRINGHNRVAGILDAVAAGAEG